MRKFICFLLAMIAGYYGMNNLFAVVEHGGVWQLLKGGYFLICMVGWLIIAYDLENE